MLKIVKKRKTRLTNAEHAWLKGLLRWRQNGIGWRALASAVNDSERIKTPGAQFVKIAGAQNIIHIHQGLVFLNDIPW